MEWPKKDEKLKEVLVGKQAVQLNLIVSYIFKLHLETAWKTMKKHTSAAVEKKDSAQISSCSFVRDRYKIQALNRAPLR